MAENNNHNNYIEYNFPIAPIGVEDDDADEALSLSELPLNADADADDDRPRSHEDHRSSPSSSSDQTHQQLFEFLTPQDCPSPADDIIFCGKLVPYRDPPPPLPPIHKSSKLNPLLRKRSESLPESQSSRAEPPEPHFVRPSRSLDSRRRPFRSRSSRSSSRRSEPEIDRNSSGNSDKAPLQQPRRPPRFRWHLLMFGMVKVPPEMELRDIKSRQVRRIPATLFPTAADPSGRRVPASRGGGGGGGKGPWAILRALSCRDDASVAVATSFNCAPQV